MYNNIVFTIAGIVAEKLSGKKNNIANLFNRFIYYIKTHLSVFCGPQLRIFHFDSIAI